MRYHWSLGIGHTYSHNNSSYARSELLELNQGVPHEVDHNTTAHTVDNEPLAAVGANDSQADEEDPDPDNPELAMEDRENEDLGSDDGQCDDERLNELDGDDELFRTYYT